MLWIGSLVDFQTTVTKVILHLLGVWCSGPLNTITNQKCNSQSENITANLRIHNSKTKIRLQIWKWSLRLFKKKKKNQAKRHFPFSFMMHGRVFHSGFILFLLPPTEMYWGFAHSFQLPLMTSLPAQKRDILIQFHGQYQHFTFIHTNHD